MTAILDTRVIEALVRSNLNENSARVLVYITEHENCKAAEIVRDLDLTQPQVSEITQKLYSAGLITRTKYIPEEGTGRYGRLPALYKADPRFLQEYFEKQFCSRADAIEFDRKTISSYFTEAV